MKQNKGITLIALIITVIVLLILAGVTINSLLGQNGLLNNSKEATQKYKYSQEKEGLSLILSSYYMAKMQDENNDIGTYLEENNATLIEEQSENYIIEYNGYEFTVKKDSLEIIYMQKVDGITPRIEVTQEKTIGKTTVKVKITNYADFEDKSSVKIVATRLSDNKVVLDTNAEQIGSFEVTEKASYSVVVSAEGKTTSPRIYEITVINVVSSISPKKEVTWLAVGESKNLEVTTVPNEDVEELTYTSSNTGVVTVDNAGKITGEAVGTADINVAGKTTTSVSAICRVVVGEASITAYNNAEVYTGKTVTPEVTITGIPETKKYTSSNPSIAAVNEDTGEVTGVAVGTCNITCTITNYNGTTDSKTCTVTVKEKIYTNGETVLLGGDKFIVLADDGTNVTLLHLSSIGKANWSDAKTLAETYGSNLGGTGRLLSYAEIGLVGSRLKLEDAYWLSDPAIYPAGSAKAIRNNPDLSTVTEYSVTTIIGVRPVVIIAKSKL